MKIRGSGIFFGNVVSLLSIVAFLIVSQGAMMTASAAEWELWPKGRGKETPAGQPVKKEEPAAKPETPEAEAAAKAGEEAGKTTAAGAASGTIGKAALIAAGLLAIGLAAAGGGGGGGGGASPPTCQQSQR